MRLSRLALLGLFVGCVELDRADVPLPSFGSDAVVDARWGGAGGDDVGAGDVDQGAADSAAPDSAAPDLALDAAAPDLGGSDGAVEDAGPPVDAVPPVDAIFLPDWSPPDAEPDAQPLDALPPDMGPPCAEQVELCDGLDNDCDGEIDEAPQHPEGGEGGVCQVDVDRCRIRGRWRCEAGAWRCGPARDAQLRDQIDAVGGCNCRQLGLLLGPLPYMACSREVTWPQAEAVCHAAGQQLVVVDTPDEAERLRAGGLFEARRVWVGLSDVAEEGAFAWVDGQPLDLEASGLGWAGDHPLDQTGEEDCAELDRTNRALRSRDCQIGNEFLCEPIAGAGED